MVYAVGVIWFTGADYAMGWKCVFLWCKGEYNNKKTQNTTTTVEYVALTHLLWLIDFRVDGTNRSQGGGGGE